MKDAEFEFAVLLAFEQGLDTRAIAKALGSPEHEVANALARIRDRQHHEKLRAA